MAAGVHDIQLRELKDTIKELNSLIRALQKTIESDQKREQEHLEHEKVLQEQIDYLTKKLFGSSSEKNVIDIPGQLNLFNEAEQECLPVPAQTEVRAHTRKPKASAADRYSALPVNEVTTELPEDRQYCRRCGTKLVPVGREYVREELVFVRPSMTLTKYYTTTYGCPKCKTGAVDDGKAMLIKAGAPKPLMPHSPASSSTVAWAAYQKFVNGVPFYRQEKDWAQYGAQMSRATLANWTIYCAAHYFRPLYGYFHRKLVKRQFLMADETRVQVLHEPERRAETGSFMWVYRSGEDGLPAIILYGYSPTRAGNTAADFLAGFQGYLETDGYAGYNKVPGIKRCCCWAHVRRYLADAIPKGKQLDYRQPAVQGVEYCNRLFHYEDTIREHQYPAEKRKEFRLQKEQPVLEAFWSWLDSQDPMLNSRMYKAVQYIRNRKPYLETYLEDGRCSFSNNLSENAIRPFTVGRKNWLFSDSVQGAEASAMTYTMVEMAKAHGLNVYNYLCFLLDHRPDDSMKDEEFERLSPWDPGVQADLRI